MLLDMIVKKLGLSDELLDTMGIYEITNVSEYLWDNSKASFVDEDTKIYFPHQITWYEFKVQQDEQPRVKFHWGILIISPNLELLGRVPVSISIFVSANGGKPVCITEGSMELDPKSRFVKAGPEGICYHVHPKVLGSPDGPFAPPRQPDHNEETKAFEMCFHRVNMVAQLLRCRNIRVDDNIVPEKLMRKYQKHGSARYVMKHKTINIIPNSTSTSKADAPSASIIGKAWHIVRGHIKTYTEEAPLFGKVTGSFFWGDTIKGSKEHGKITKDYKLGKIPK